MRYNVNHDNAPINLDETAKVINLKPSEDAYTMYSAVRVIGGKGEGNLKFSTQKVNGQHNFLYGDVEIVDSQTLKLKYPVSSFVKVDGVVYTTDITQFVPAHGTQFFDVGFSGIDDNDSNYQALTSYGSNEIKLKSGYSFYDMPSSPSTSYLSVSYYPMIPICTRIVDPILKQEIINQRGGTGIIEYLLKDDTITDFTVAADTATAFLQENAKRAFTVEFDTSIPGWEVGQLLNCNVPYYNVIGDYQITSVSLAYKSSSDGNIWQYHIQASTVAYRDSLKLLFNINKKVNFKLGTDFPANDGTMINTTINIGSEITIRAIDPTTWAEIDAYECTWEQIEAKISSWKDFENTLQEWDLEGNYLSVATKIILIGLLNGNTINQETIDSSGLHVRLSDGSGYNIRSPIYKIYPSKNSILRTYYIGTPELNQPISFLLFGYLGMSVGVQKVETSITKTENFALMIEKIDTINGTYLTDAAKSILIGLLNGDTMVEPYLENMNLSIYDSTTNETIVYLNPLGTAKVLGDSITRNYYIDESYAFKNPYATTGEFDNPDGSVKFLQNIPLNVDKSATNSLGPYALTIVKKDTVI